MPSSQSVAQRITEVWSNSKGSRGSGYLLAGGLILTARHVVMPEGSEPPTVIKVRPLGIADLVDGLQPADLVWPDLAQLANQHAPDAALLRLQALPKGLPEALKALPHFGRTDDTGGCGTPVSAIGFPAFAEKAGERYDTEEISGIVFLGTKLVAGRYEIAEMTVRDKKLEQERDWYGMSGAALLSGGRVIGVLIARRHNDQRYDFSAVRIDALLTIPGFRDAISGHVELGKGEARRPWAKLNPYRGLAAYSSANADFFFGREALTAHILTSMQNEPNKALALIGGSGVGKSSLAQAGVIAALKRQKWPTKGAWPAALAESRSWLTLTIRPYDTPLKSLALAFTSLLHERSSVQDADAEDWVRKFRDGAGFADLMRIVKYRLTQKPASDASLSFLLFIDQAEELYVSTRREHKPDANAKLDAETFSRLIAEAAGRADCRVMLSLGSGYLNSLDADEALSAVSQVVYVPPMASDALQQAIERPAVAFGVRFEPDEMPSIIACNIVNQAGALPLLGYLLSEKWRQMQERDDGVMRFDEPPKDFDVSATLRERVECYCAEGKAQERDLERLFTLRLTPCAP